MTPDEALKIAQAAATANGLRFTRHAIERMQERIAAHPDVYNAVRTADAAMQSDDGLNRWVLVGGCDLDECGLKVVVAIDEDGVVTVTVVTVYP